MVLAWQSDQVNFSSLGRRQQRGIHLMLAAMTPEQKDMVQESFALVVPIADTAGSLFYDRLFELDPTLRDLFRGNIQEQSKKLMQMLSVAVAGLDNLERIVPALHALGRRHVAYGVRPRHFDTVATALLWTLETGLGPRFTAEVRQAWGAVFALVAATMQEGMQVNDAFEDAMDGIAA
jgi:hemoglobin-like flavoprotein